MKAISELTVAVIVASNDKPPYLRLNRCLRSILSQTTPPAEVVVALDKPVAPPMSPSLPSFVRILADPGGGLSSARNLGAANASAEILAFIDDDAEAAEDWIAQIARDYETSEVVASGGPVIPVWETRRPLWFHDGLLWVVGCTTRLMGAASLPVGCNMSIRRRTLLGAGGFHPRLGRQGGRLIGSEETELWLRLTNSGTGFVTYNPNARVFHHIPSSRMSIRYLLLRSYGEGASKHLMRKRLRARGFPTGSDREGAFVRTSLRELGRLPPEWDGVNGGGNRLLASLAGLVATSASLFSAAVGFAAVIAAAGVEKQAPNPPHSQGLEAEAMQRQR